MLRLVTSALIVSLVGAAAYAQTPAPALAPGQSAAPAKPRGAAMGMGMVVPRADANNDGKLTLDELEAAEHRGLISKLDINHDGVISKPEFKNLVDAATARGGEQAGKRMVALFLLLDTDKSGTISQAERDAATKRRFQMVDTNHDGWLSKAEVTASGQMRPRAN
jgi:hypothetical protein